MLWQRRVVGRFVHIERLRLFHWLGRRGLLLLLFGSLWILYGLAIFFIDQPPRFSATFSKPIPLLIVLDWHGAGALWVACGVTSVVTCFVRGYREGRDATGFNALLAPPFVWTLGYLWSLAAYFVTGGQYGRATALVPIVVWFIVCGFLLLCSGWPDPDDPARHIKDVESDGH